MLSMSMAESIHCEISLVKSLQDKMTSLLSRAPLLSTEEQNLLHRFTDLLRTRSEEMIIFIQVMLGIKQELAYARLDLERAVSLNMRVNEDRRRVNWLSERLRKLSRLCHSYYHDLQIGTSKLSIYGDESSFQFASTSCLCGMLKNPIIESGEDTRSGVKKVLDSSSDVLVYRQGGSVQKVFKPPKNFLPSENEVFLPDDIGSSPAHEVMQIGIREANLSPPIPVVHIANSADEDVNSLSPFGLIVNEKNKLQSLVNYQKKALDQLVENLNNLYTNLDEKNDPVSNAIGDSSNDSSKEAVDINSKKFSDTSSTIPEKWNDFASPNLVEPKKPYVENVGSDSTLLKPFEVDDGVSYLQKKEIYPRSPSVWCDYSACSSPISQLNVNFPKLENRPMHSHDVLAPITTEKAIVMKRAVNRVKVIQKLKPAKKLSQEEAMKMKRIENLLGNAGIQSDNKNIAVDAAKALGELKCRDEAVIIGLQNVIDRDKRKLLKYECAKSLIILGNWHDSAMNVLTNHLKKGNKKIQEDILFTLKRSQNAHFVPKTSAAYISLSDALTNLLHNEDMTLAFNAALSLGYLCINKEKSKWLLLDSLGDSSYSTKYEALKVLVKQMNCQNDEVIDALLLQIGNANCCKHRMKAIDLLRDIGSKRLNRYGLRKVFKILEELLWNHSNEALRAKVVNVLEGFGLRKEAATNVLKRLNDKSESVRADSIVALTTLEMKGERELKMLLDMFDLDSSTHVRGEVIKAFVAMKWNHPHVLRVLEDRQKGDDVLAKKASKAFHFLVALTN